MIGSKSSLKAAIVHVMMHPTVEMSLLLLYNGEYVVADGHGTDQITIDPEFSDSVNYHRASTGGVVEEFLPLIYRHVELLEWVLEKPEVMQ